METGLINLKAELQRKKSIIKEGGIDVYKERKTKLALNDSNKGVAERAAKDAAAISDEDNLENKVKEMLEKKTSLYDRIKNSVDVLDDDKLNERFLIDFQKKIVNDIVHNKTASKVDKIDTDASPEAYTAKDSDEEWIEYIDVFGRSRMCQRKDLEKMKEQDSYITGIKPETKKFMNVYRLKSCKEKLAYPMYSLDLAHSVYLLTFIGDKPYTVQGKVLTQEEIEKQLVDEITKDKHRKKWDKAEFEANHKRDVHYQDVHFDEARDFGVAFMKFSREESERQEQVNLLKKLREETKVEEIKSKTEASRKAKVLKIRLAKVRQKQRLKHGLPMIEDDEEEESSSLFEEDEVGPLPEEIPLPSKDPEHITKKDIVVREWDLGKKGVTMTQEEWLEKQREKRKSEFAPPSSYARSRHKSKKTHSSFSDVSKKSSDKQERTNSTNSEGRNPEFGPPASSEYYGQTSHPSEPTLGVVETDLELAISKGIAHFRKLNSQ